MGGVAEPAHDCPDEGREEVVLAESRGIGDGAMADEDQLSPVTITGRYLPELEAEELDARSQVHGRDAHDVGVQKGLEGRLGARLDHAGENWICDLLGRLAGRGSPPGR